MALAIGETARCRRCGATLYRCPPTSVDASLALTLAAIVLFVVANTFPIVVLSMNSTLVETTLFRAVRVLYDNGMWPLAGLVFATTLLIPLLDIAAVAYVLLPLKMGHIPRRPDIVLRVLRVITPWGMTEVLILGMLAATVKLTAIATVVPGIAMWAFGEVLLAAAASTFDLHDIWSLINRVRSCQITGSAEEGKISPSTPTAARAGLFVCHGCGLLSKPAAQVHEGHCPRCSAGLHFRKPGSIARTLAFVVAAMVPDLPAKMLPVMDTSSLLGEQTDTILSGVVYRWTSGSWPIAVIVFIASIAVPMLKIIALIFLVLTAQLRWRWRPRKTHAPLSDGETCGSRVAGRGSRVAARYLRHHHPGRSRAVQRARDDQGGLQRDCFRCSRRAEDVRLGLIRPASDLRRHGA